MQGCRVSAANILLGLFRTRSLPSKTRVKLMACLKMSSSRITTFAGHPVPDCKLSYFCPRHCLRHGDFAHLFPLPSGRMHGRGCAYPGLSCTPRGLQELGLQRGPNPNLEPTLGRFITYEATSSFSVYCSSDFADCLTWCYMILYALCY